MTSLWDIDGNNLDQIYVNLREASYAAELNIRGALDNLWETYEPFADQDFRQGFARDPEARFWEMYLAVRLLENGKTLLPTDERQSEGGQPDICVLDGGRRIWIEATTPQHGEPGPDMVTTPIPINQGGRAVRSPRRQAQLRVTSALWTKLQAINRYQAEGIIAQDDVSLIAINAGRFGVYIGGGNLPLILSAVFPIGDEYVVFDRETFELVDRGFHSSFHIDRQGSAIPRTAFIENEFTNISGVIWSRISIGNMSHTQRPISLVHNPMASVIMSQEWGVWDKEFVATEDNEVWTVENILD